MKNYQKFKNISGQDWILFTLFNTDQLIVLALPGNKPISEALTLSEFTGSINTDVINKHWSDALLLFSDLENSGDLEQFAPSKPVKTEINRPKYARGLIILQINDSKRIHVLNWSQSSPNHIQLREALNRDPEYKNMECRDQERANFGKCLISDQFTVYRKLLDTSTNSLIQDAINKNVCFLGSEYDPTPDQVMIKAVRYSEKSFAVIGDTFPIRNLLKSLNGRFNKRLECGPGWIFGVKNQSEILSTLKIELS